MTKKTSSWCSSYLFTINVPTTCLQKLDTAPTTRFTAKLPHTPLGIIVFGALVVEEYDVCRCVPWHAVTSRRYHEAGLPEQTFRCCRRGWDRKMLASQLGDVGVQHLVLPPPREKAAKALHCLFRVTSATLCASHPPRPCAPPTRS